MINLKTKLISFSAIFAVLAVGSSLIVSSQSNQSRVEISSLTGLMPKPDNLKIPQNREDQRTSKLPANIPDDVAYRQIFKHIEELNKKADREEQQKGKDGKKLRNHYKQMARLDERQARILDKIAGNTNHELEKLDKRAKQIIEQVRSQTPNRRIEQGQKPPLPPQELFDLAKQRKDVTLKAVSELRASLGEAEFVRFSQFVNEKVKSGIQKKGSGAAILKGGQPK
jgi:hypothetical protein